jgi:DNA topoisomerase-2
LRPDTYIGSVERESQLTWVYDEQSKKMTQRTIHFVPGLFKIFDEILVNAADNKQRDPTMTTLKVELKRETNEISVWNDGRGIPVQMHSEHQCYVPELIFGHLLTSSNYNDTEKKTVGGRNGYGAKLANIFSTKFTVETLDSQQNKKYVQTWTRNMQDRQTPKIRDHKSGRDYTKITFCPDMSKFGMPQGLDDDIIALIRKRVYDVAGTCPKIKVFYNGERISIGNFKDYVRLHFKGDSESQDVVLASEKCNDRWEVAVSKSEGHFQQVSFVNNISTMKGGSHVTYVTDQIVHKLLSHINKKNKMLNLKPHHLKHHLFVFVNALIENPAFDSQTKVNLTCNPKTFGSTCEISDALIRKLLKTGVVDDILSLAKFKQSKALQKNDGKKKVRLSGIDKLDDANDAGGKNGSQCTLILTEGDSAKALAVAGLSVVGRDRYGVFPLKGKPLNVRDASHDQIMKNAEISNLKQILGLKQGVTYEDTKALRYGRVMIMADQDYDGSHIKGLLINLFASFWPSLLRMSGFLTEFITPIVKVTHTKRNHTQTFYTIPEYETWYHAQPSAYVNECKIKYYKGLGTSTAAEAKHYFADLARHQIDFSWSSAECERLIDMAFNKKKADERKQWIESFVSGTYLDQDVASISYTDFVNRELVLFSMASNQRAIPSVVDGLKPGQRKILFACMKRKLVKEIKVAQLAGYVSEQAAYHHGEMSLNGTIIGMAQDFVGSNNVNVLAPQGQFGTRLAGGKDSASPRYIFTHLSPITRTLFMHEDSAILTYLEDDGMRVEPEFYVPILPMVLVNGSAGIGTGWSSNVPNYCPRDLVAHLRYKLRDDHDGDGEPKPPELRPWYRGFTGTIREKKSNEKQYVVCGLVQKSGPTSFRISELPIGTWTSAYKSMLEEMMEKGSLLKDVREYHTDTTVCFEVTTTNEQALATIETKGPVSFFKLTTSISLTNMVLYDSAGQIRRYESAEEILDDFFQVRMRYYEKRKAHLSEKLEEQMARLQNRWRFIQEVVSGTLVVQNRPKAQLWQELRDREYHSFPPLFTNSDDEAKNENDTSAAEHVAMDRDYDYLLGMAIWSLTQERMKNLERELEKKRKEWERVCGTSVRQMYRVDLEAFMTALDSDDEERKKENHADKKTVTQKSHVTSTYIGYTSPLRVKQESVRKKRKVDSISRE